MKSFRKGVRCSLEIWTDGQGVAASLTQIEHCSNLSEYVLREEKVPPTNNSLCHKIEQWGRLVKLFQTATPSEWIILLAKLIKKRPVDGIRLKT